jgi:hypothetical protein
MKAFLYFTISLVLLAGVAVGIGAATGHVKHECSYTSDSLNGSFGGSSTNTKTCSWKLK